MSMATVIVTTAIVGAGVQAYGQYQQNKNAQAQAKAQAAINMYNSKVAQREAEAEAKAARFESAQFAKKAKSLRKRQSALTGASGIEVEGSPLLVQEDTAAELALEASNIRTAGQRRVMAKKSQSILDISAASAAKSRAAGYGQAAITSAAGTSLQGVASAKYAHASYNK